MQRQPFTTNHSLGNNRLGRPPQHLLFSHCSFHNKIVIAEKHTSATQTRG